MKPHGANKSPDYHRAMAEQYLYNATRSLAASDDQLAGFKTWSDGLARDASSTSHFLGALAGYHTTKQWPWQVNEQRQSFRNDAMARMAEAAKGRPADFADLPPAEQWAIDKHLGILDWDGTDGTPGPQGARVDEALPRD